MLALIAVGTAINISLLGWAFGIFDFDLFRNDDDDENGGSGDDTSDMADAGSGNMLDDIDGSVQSGTGSGGATGAGSTDGGSTDGGSTDGSGTDGGSTDGSGTDGGSTDGGSTDGGSTDGGSTDGGSTDGGSTDGGSTDGSGTDGGSTDGGSTDGGGTDGGGTDGPAPPDPGLRVSEGPFLRDGIGTDGADRILAGETDTLTGGDGTDLFVALAPTEEDPDFGRPVSGLTITDFQPGFDRILVVSEPDDGDASPERLDVYDWEIREGGVALVADPETGDPYDIAFLEGLTTPPPDTDVGVILNLGSSPDPIELDPDALDAAFPGDGRNFMIRETFTDADEFPDYDDPGAPGYNLDSSRVLELDAGGGNDIVFFSGVDADVDLGTGDDVYNGYSEALPGETVPTATIFGNDGADTFNMNESIVTIEGGEGDDRVLALTTWGGSIDGGLGDDYIAAGISPDAVEAGVDPLVLTGGEGVDRFDIDYTKLDIDADVGPIADITDFDPATERLVINVSPLYNWPGGPIEPTLGTSPDGIPQIEIDGNPIVLLRGDITSIDDIEIDVYRVLPVDEAERAAVLEQRAALVAAAEAEAEGISA